MTRSSENRSMRDRIEQLGHDIRTQGTASRIRDADELAEIEARHADLHRRLAELEAQAKPEHHIAGALEADLNGLAQSVRRWIARQDAKASGR